MMERGVPDALREAAKLMDEYQSLGTLEELREQRAQLQELQALQSELEARNRIIDELNRRIDWMQRYTTERQTNRKE